MIDTRISCDRRALLRGAAAIAAVATMPRSSAADAPPSVRVGYQKSSILAILRARGLLEKKLGPGTAVSWAEFQFGPPLVEAMNGGHVDYGYAGNAPPIFGQAAHAAFVYVAALPGRGDNVAILVPPDSAVKTVGDLAGRKVAVGKGSSGHDFLVAALDRAGVAYSAIKPVYLAPADGAAAFFRGSVDAWSIWDPYLAIAETAHPARALPVDRDMRQDAFFLANAAFAAKHPQTVAAINAAVAEVAEWSRANREEATKLYASVTGVELAAQRRAVERTTFEVSPITAAIVGRQQASADRFFKLGLLPKQITIREAVWAGS